MSMNRFASHPEELISASLSDELTPVERRELDAHLAACPQCRGTLESFRAQRDLLSHMAQPPVPRDMAARVRAGIASGRGEPRWWRRPTMILAGVASLGTVAAALLVTAILLNRNTPIVAASASPAESPSPSSVASTSATPTAAASPTAPPLDMHPGDLLYASVQGPFDKLELKIVREQSGKAVEPSKPDAISWDQVKRASLAPDGGAYAFAMEAGQKGTWRIFVTDLTDGTTTQLAEIIPQAFGRRLLWSPDGRYLAFTVMPGAEGKAGPSDVWIYDREAHASQPVTKAANAYAASWAPLQGSTETLWISEGAADPSSYAIHFDKNAGVPTADAVKPSDTAAGVFMPLIAPDGSRAIFWRGTMQAGDLQGWIFARAGLPYLTDPARTGPTAWSSAQPLFGDLALDQSGQAFNSGEVTWAADSDAYAFWDGHWTGTNEGGGNTTYPDANAVYAGRASQGPLTQSSRLNVGKMTSASGDPLEIVDVALSPDGKTAAVTLLVPIGGIGASPSAYLRTAPLDGGPPTDIGAPTASPPWLGPGTYVPETVGP